MEADLTDLPRLRARGEALAGASRSPWEPACIARAFARPAPGDLTFTMQGWIDLAAARSPLLVDELPGTDEQIASAFDVFLPEVEIVPAPEETLLLLHAMRRTVNRAFAASLPMRPPGATPAASLDGFGTFGPLLACLVAQCGLSRDAAMAAPVEQAFILIASHRHNLGWEPAGTPYAWREPAEGERPTSNAQRSTLNGGPE